MRKLLIAALISGGSAFAATNSETTLSTQVDSNRLAKRLGAAIGVVGDPYPSILGINVAYNVADFLRAKVGYGEVEATTGITINNEGAETRKTKVTTIGGGLVGFMPGWSLSPTLGMHLSNVSTEGDGKITIQGYEGSGTLAYASLGMDWQAGSGFNTALGYNYPIGGKGAGSFYATLGWFFDLM